MSFEAQLGSALKNTIGYFLDLACISGSGAGKPMGLLSDPALITIAKESGQTADTIVYQNCTKMFARMAPQCLGNAIWIGNNTILPQLLEMTLTSGTTTNFVPAVTMVNGKFYLLGKEILLTEKNPVLGDAGDLIFVDLQQYALGLRKEVTLDKSNAPGWLKDQSSYRVILRADGQGTWDKPITPRNGDTLSWVVTLEARA
jgi:HK97 family phage major capsid protein